jgi:formamidopyrimidine-DNA glycosylase
MPELPEVETVCRQLAPILAGTRIIGARIYDEKLRQSGVSRLKGRRILGISRVGKEIIISFEEKLFLEVHLRMTGQLIWCPDETDLKIDSGASLYRRVSPSPKALRASFSTEKGELRFYDVRRFGTLKLSDRLPQAKALDPVREKLTGSILAGLIGDSPQQIKLWLLRQDRLAGIGNIYASEILFDAGVAPSRRASSLSSAECTKLAKSTARILNLAIKKSGTTFSDYRDANGESGGFQKLLKVYDREGAECNRCGELILRTVQGQRSTFWCANCQR